MLGSHVHSWISYQKNGILWLVKLGHVPSPGIWEWNQPCPTKLHELRTKDWSIIPQTKVEKMLQNKGESVLGRLKITCLLPTFFLLHIYLFSKLVFFIHQNIMDNYISIKFDQKIAKTRSKSWIVEKPDRFTLPGLIKVNINNEKPHR